MDWGLECPTFQIELLYRKMLARVKEKIEHISITLYCKNG